MQKLVQHKWGWLILIAAFVAINFLASIVHTKFDLTKEKRYTITTTTKNLLKKLDDKLEVQVFLSGELPAGFQKLSNTTRDFLDVLKESNNARISYHFIAPEEEIEDANGKYGDTLVALGATPINLTVQIKQGQQSKVVFPYALVKYKEQEMLVNLYSGGKRYISAEEMNNAEAMMEYNFAKALSSLMEDEKPMLAYATGNGEAPLAGLTPTGNLMNPATFDLMSNLRRDYNVFAFDISKRAFIPDTFKVLMIVKPTLQFTDDEKLKMDQYLMRGGKIVCFIDNLNAEKDSLMSGEKRELIAYDRNLNLTDFFFKYGVRINPDLVMDLQCDFLPQIVGGTSGNPQIDFLPWNYYPWFESRNNHPINKNLGLVGGRFVNSIDTVKAAGITKTILLSSSANSRKLGTPALISFNENRYTPEDALFRQKDIPVGVLLEGNFISLFRNRIPQSQIDTLKQQGFKYMPEGNVLVKKIVVADGDMVLNDFNQKYGPLPMGQNLYTVGGKFEYQLANRDFLLNSLEFLTSNAGLMGTRNKEVVLRLLDTQKVEKEKLQWQVINIGLPLLLVILCGFIYQQLRKKKYAAQ
jgi:ABC-2 type transport system permease protein